MTFCVLCEKIAAITLPGGGGVSAPDPQQGSQTFEYMEFSAHQDLIPDDAIQWWPGQNYLFSIYLNVFVC